MSPQTQTAPARLERLLPWLNGAFDRPVPRPGDRPENVATWTDYEAVRRSLETFVRSFDGSAGAGHLAAVPDDSVIALKDEAIDDLEPLIRILLEQGFGDPTLDDLALPVTALRVAVRSAGRQPPRWTVTKGGSPTIDGGAKALQSYRAPGAYVLRVQGPTLALVPFLVAHLLTQSGMVAVKRCERRDQSPWADCSHLFVVAPGARGRPQRFCSTSCGVRFAEQERAARKSQTARKPRGRRK